MMRDVAGQQVPLHRVIQRVMKHGVDLANRCRRKELEPASIETLDIGDC
jgi:hypothetical protein